MRVFHTNSTSHGENSTEIHLALTGQMLKFYSLAWYNAHMEEINSSFLFLNREDLAPNLLLERDLLSRERGYGVNTICALEEAKELLQHHWTKGSFARDIQGKPVPVQSDRAVSFDLLGAIARVTNDDSTYAEIFDCVSECIEEPLPNWNDSASREEVLGCLSEVIGCLRSRKNEFADAA